ncbi:MAG TPA: TlpA disulfide reductase family protein [Actinomycetota bacterium]|nr:TlpA disulfide reductase family protein [Actinomycetota bacterium]
MEAEALAPAPATPRKLKIVRLLAFVLVPALFVGFIAFTLLTTAPPSSLVGKTLPAFSLEVLGSDERLTAADLEGKAVVVNFWASWCDPCIEEVPDLQAAHTRYADDDVVVLGVNVQDSERDALAFAEKYGVTYPIVRDPNLTLYKELGVRGLPETFFVDKQGVFIGIGSGRQIGQSGTTKTLGAIDPALLDSQIRAMIGEN